MLKLDKHCFDILPNSSMESNSTRKRGCAEGLMQTSTKYLRYLNCSSSVTTKMRVCMGTFRGIFAANISNSSLCTWVYVNYFFCKQKLKKIINLWHGCGTRNKLYSCYEREVKNFNNFRCECKPQMFLFLSCQENALLLDHIPATRLIINKKTYRCKLHSIRGQAITFFRIKEENEERIVQEMNWDILVIWFFNGCA